MKKSILAISILLLICTGCADVEPVSQCLHGHTYGFWAGLWHGIISPFAFIGSWFSDDIAVWANNNDGGWYTYGFLLGITVFIKVGSLPMKKIRSFLNWITLPMKKKD